MILFSHATSPLLSTINTTFEPTHLPSSHTPARCPTPNSVPPHNQPPTYLRRDPALSEATMEETLSSRCSSISSSICAHTCSFCCPGSGGGRWSS